MADDNQLNISFSGSVDGLVQSTKTAQAAIGQFSDSVKTQSAAVNSSLTSAFSPFTKFNPNVSALASASTALRSVETAAGSAGHGTAGFYREIVVLGHEVVSGNFSRIPGSMMVMAERSGQLTTIFESLAVLATPLGAGIAALAVSLGTVAYQALQASRTLDAVRTAMDSVGNGASFNAGQNKAFLSYLEQYGISGKVARAALVDVEGAVGGNTAEFGKLVALLPTVNAMMRGDTAEASKFLALAISDPSKAIDILHQKYDALSPAQLEAARNYQDNGEKAQETAVVIQALTARAADLHDEVEGKLNPRLKELELIFQGLLYGGNPFSALLHNITVAAGMAADAVGRLGVAANPNGKVNGPSDSMAAAQRENNDILNAGYDLERKKGLEVARQEELQGQINQLKQAENAAILQGNNALAQRFAKDQAEVQNELNNLKPKGGINKPKGQGSELSDWQAELDNKLTADQAFGEKAKAEEIEFWQQKKALATAGTTEYNEITSRLYDLQNQQYEKDTEAAKAAERAKTEAEKQAAEERNRDILKHFDELAALYKDDYTKYVQIEQQKATFVKAVYGQESAQAEQQQAKLDQIEQQHLDKIKQQWSNAFSGIKSSVNSGIMSMIQGTETFGQAVGNVFLSLGQSVAGVLEDMAEKWLITEIVGETSSQTQAHAGIAASAAQAGAAAFASIAAIPIIGPAMAPAAGAAAYTGALAYEGLASFDVGSWNLPSDMVAQVHKGEMIIPRTFADDLRSNGGLTGASGGDHFHIHAIDTRGMSRFIRNNSDAVASAVRTAGRNGNRNLNG